MVFSDLESIGCRVLHIVGCSCPAVQQAALTPQTAICFVNQCCEMKAKLQSLSNNSCLALVLIYRLFSWPHFDDGWFVSLACFERIIKQNL